MRSKQIKARVKALAEKIPGGQFRVSMKGVPYVIFPHSGHMKSVCYFARMDIYRVFTPWGEQDITPTQSREDFGTEADFLKVYGRGAS